MINAVRILGLAVLLAWSAGAEPPAVRKSLHMSFLNRSSGDRFYQVLRSRKYAGLDLDALVRMQREKEKQSRELNASLQKQHGLNPTSNYRIDVNSRTLYLVKDKQSALQSPEAKMVRVFKSEEAMQALLKRLLERRFVEMSRTTLQLLHDEKSRQVQSLVKQLEDKYGLSPRHSYLYSASSNAVFKVEKAK